MVSAPALMTALRDSDPNVVGWSIWALGRMDAVRAIPALEKIVADAKQPEPVKQAAKDAVAQLKKKKAAVK